MSIIEIEMRGPLTSDSYQKTLEFLQKEANFKKEKRRVLIDYSTFLDTDGFSSRTLDIRSRITNGEGEMIIKQGAFGGSDVRREVSVPVAGKDYLPLVEAYALMGYKKGVLCVRNTMAFEYKGVEVALIEVPGHSYFFEAEIELDKEEGIEEAQKVIRSVCDELSLTLYSDDEYFAYVETLNEEANGVFDYEVDGLAKLESVLREQGQI